MKKNYFLAFLIFMSNFQLYSANLFEEKTHIYFYTVSGISFSSSNEVTLYSEENKESGKTSFDEIKGGTKLVLPFCEFRLMGKTHTDFDFNASLEDWKNHKNYNYGACFFTDYLIKDFPCSIKYGNLSIAGAYSKLNNPLLSNSVSAFGISGTSTSIINASLPGYTVYSKPESLFIQYGYKFTKNHNKTLQNLAFNYWYSPEDDITLTSGNFNLNLGKYVKLGFSEILGNIPYGENTFNSWFTSSDFYFHEDRHLCTGFQASLEVPHFQTLFSSYGYESPWGDYNWIFKSENKIKYFNYTVCFSAFINNNDFLLTSSQNQLEKCYQFKFAIQNKKKLNTSLPIFVKTGFNSFANIKPDDEKKELKTAVGLQISSLPCSFTGTFNLTSKIQTENAQMQSEISNISFNIKTVFNFIKLIPDFSANYVIFPKSVSEEKTFKQKYNLNLLLNQKHNFFSTKIYNDNSISITQKDDIFEELKCNTGISLTFNTKYITCFIKMSIEFFMDS